MNYKCRAWERIAVSVVKESSNHTILGSTEKHLCRGNVWTHAYKKKKIISPRGQNVKRGSLPGRKNKTI